MGSSMRRYKVTGPLAAQRSEKWLLAAMCVLKHSLREGSGLESTWRGGTLLSSAVGKAAGGVGEGWDRWALSVSVCLECGEARGPSSHYLGSGLTSACSWPVLIK